jgi:mono/diheme cytochrome c family protein
MVSEGASLFTGSCQTCHGPGGRNGPYGPDLTDAVYLHNSGGFEEIVAIIDSGVSASQFRSPSSQAAFFMQPRGGMTLTDAQLRALGAYVWALSHSR